MSHAETRVSKEEWDRRESFFRSNTRPFNIWDPYTYRYRYKAGLFSLATCLGSIHLYNSIWRTAWWHGIVPKLASTAIATAIGFGYGLSKEYQAKTRDAVTDHYMSLYPEDFKQINDYYGRPYSVIMQPWNPRRATYNKSHKKDNDDYEPYNADLGKVY